MGRRTVKQILYGAGYLAVLFLIVFSAYLIWFKPAPTCFDNKQNQNETGVDCGGPCLPCEIRTLTPLEASSMKYFPSDSQIIFVVEIKNSNLNWAADSFSYTFEIYGENGAKIKSFTENSFIYAGEIKYIIEPVEINSADVKDVKISFSNLDWKTKDEFTKPEVQTREIKTEKAESGVSELIVSGFINNSNAFSLSKARIIAFLSDKTGTQIGASKTELENIAAFTERPFKINFPKNITLMTTSTSSLNLLQVDPGKTKVYVEALR
jgi:hypothetical protein